MRRIINLRPGRGGFVLWGALPFLLAGIAYAGLWLLESWTSRSPAAVAGHMTWSLAMLLLALACCYGLYRVCARHSQRAGRILCSAIGIAMLLAHIYSGGI